jgi:hypothetical protein
MPGPGGGSGLNWIRLTGRGLLPLFAPRAPNGTATLPQHRKSYWPQIGVQRAAGFMVIEATPLRVPRSAGQQLGSMAPPARTSGEAPRTCQRPPQAQQRPQRIGPARLKPLNTGSCSIVRVPTVKPPSVLDPCGSHTTSRPMIGSSFDNSPLSRSR